MCNVDDIASAIGSPHSGTLVERRLSAIQWSNVGNDATNRLVLIRHRHHDYDSDSGQQAECKEHRNYAGMLLQENSNGVSHPGSLALGGSLAGKLSSRASSSRRFFATLAVIAASCSGVASVWWRAL